MRFQKKLVVFSMLVCTSLYLTGCENTGTLPDTYNNFEQSFLSKMQMVVLPVRLLPEPFPDSLIPVWIPLQISK